VKKLRVAATVLLMATARIQAEAPATGSLASLVTNHAVTYSTWDDLCVEMSGGQFLDPFALIDVTVSAWTSGLTSTQILAMPSRASSPLSVPTSPCWPAPRGGNAL
jgi:hypothetical protein